ncbi:MAG: RNA polymerase sigma factor FliA [Gammaproteobacteria bacterium]|nr:MAG: RNA polymerase sigma factor FliA [Gammaproteobacteria bacterium]
MTMASAGVAMYSETRPDQAETVVLRHAPLVKRIALHLKGRLPPSVQLDDLIQSGMLGLLEAARKYDAAQGASFETYAAIRIRGAMIDEIRRGDWVPRSVHRNARRIAEAIHEIESRTGKDAQDTDVARELGMSLDEYHACLKDALSGHLISLDELTTDSDTGLPDRSEGCQPDSEVVDMRFRQRLAEEIDRLPERERLVLALYYDEELNLKEIGQVLGVSESRVSQIHSQAALRLRARLADWHVN